MSTFYRFRSIEHLLGTKYLELENQSIFFASPEQLNDPMEGYRDFFWAGDLIIWKNFFRHYLRCLQHALVLYNMHGEGHHTISIDELPLFSAADDFPTEDYRKLAQDIEQLFFGRDDVIMQITGMANSASRIRRDELRYHLNYLHLIAFDCVANVHEAHGLMSKRMAPVQDMRTQLQSVEHNKFFKKCSELRKAHEDGSKFLEELFRVSAQLIENLTLRNFAAGRVDPTAKNKNFVVLDFPERYLKAIERLAFPDWYTACFMSECSNSSIWGNYGHNHTGVCLVFEGKDYADRSVLPVHAYNAIGAGGLIKGVVELPFSGVNYTEGYAKIDFFRSIGRMPAPDLSKTWYLDADGKASVCAEDMYRDEKAWRERYWSNFLGDVIRKTEDWAYEKEYRLILYGNVVNYSDPRNRTLTYDFASLKGLIFGINTKTEDKLKIVEIITRKCQAHKRVDFKFYQAYYDPHKRNIGHIEVMHLLPPL